MNYSKLIVLRSFCIDNYIWFFVVIWTMVVIVSLVWNLIQVKQHAYEEMRSLLRAVYETDVVYRRWNAKHKGVYVPVTAENLPNPYLSHIPDRDLTSTSGKLLTLMNPSYMTRQVHELMDEQYSIIQGHITSLNPLRPENIPDTWETKALKAFEKGEIEVLSTNKMKDDITYMRFMRPMITEERCLKCHAIQGYQVGDIRGGISVSIPITQRTAVVRKEIISLSFFHGLLWLLAQVYHL